MAEWLNEDHLARFVVEVIDHLDLSNLTRQYSGHGSKAYHPATLLAIVVYGYATGVFSSRRLERATYDSVAFRYIAANSHPDHATLASFRRRFLDELASLFVQILDTVRCHMGTSRSLQFNSRRKCRNCWRWQNMRIRPIFRMASNCRRKLNAAKTGSSAWRRLTPRLQPGLQSAMRKRRRNTSRRWLVGPMLDTLKEQTAALGAVERMIADTGYCSEKNIKACDDVDIEPLIAVARDEHHPGWRARHSEPSPLPATATPMQAMAHKLKIRAGRAAYALRMQTVEPVFGIIKSVMGFRQFSLRGLKKVSGEWTLVCLAWNVKRMAVLRPNCAGSG